MRAGLLVTPNVRVVELLGEGAMGSVWLADQLALDTQVVVKFIRASPGANADSAVARFKREASLAAKLSSPHVVRIFDYGVLEGEAPFIVMERLKGETLEARLGRDGSLGLEDTGSIVTQIGRVLAEAHALGIIHRDIKPANLFLVAQGDDPLFVKVLDFGVAKSLTPSTGASITTSGAIVGSPGYMSPELLRGDENADQFADLWALAAVAYQCLTGALPLEGSTLGELVLAAFTKDIRAPSSHVKDLPAEIDAFFARALHRERAERFQSAKELASAFLEAAGLAGDAAFDIGPRTRSARPPNEPRTAAIQGTLGGSASPTGARPSLRSQLWLPVAAIVLIAGLGVAYATGVFSGWKELPAAPTSKVNDANQDRFQEEQRDQERAREQRAQHEEESKRTADSAPSAVADAALSAAASALPSAQRSSAPALPRLPPPPSATVHAKPAYCTSGDAFTVNEKGFLVPKPECL